jgi:hypothetical protein
MFKMTIKKIGNLYQIDDNETPIDSATLRNTLASLTNSDDPKVSKIMDDIDEKEETSLEIQGSKGVVVDLYEVDYQSADPMKETQNLAKSLNEKRDFVTQYLFPDSTTDDVLVGLRQDVLKGQDQSQPTRGPQEQEPARLSNLESMSSLFQLSYARDLSEDQKQDILETQTISSNLLFSNLKLQQDNWVRLKAKSNKLNIEALIGTDTFRYLISLQKERDVEHYSIDYASLVKLGVNPLDLIDVVEACQLGSPSKVDEDTTLDQLINACQEPIIQIYGRKVKRSG